MKEAFWGKVTVVGAAGRMGKGISLVLLQEMARDQAERFGKVEGGKERLNLIDSNEEAVFSLRRYLRPHLTRYAEKTINQLRDYYAKREDLVSNKEIIEAFVEGALDMVHCDTEAAAAKGSHIIFEAVSENLDIKDALYLELRELCACDTHYFTNTSSLPIGTINEIGRLSNRIVGFHFYNPPQTQKLVELIIPEETEYTTQDLAHEVAKRLNKTTVYSNDVAGFIGNGHFIREVAFACDMVEKLQKNYPIDMAISIVNTVTKDFLFRPMGIFELVDFVGADVCHQIALIMEEQIPDSGLVKKLMTKMQGKKFFSYDGHQLTGVYSLESGEYRAFQEEMEAIIGPKPEGSWSELRLKRDAEYIIEKEFDRICSDNSLGTELMIEFLKHSCRIGNMLVQTNVARSIDDVDTVLRLGFGHLYSCLTLPSMEIAK